MSAVETPIEIKTGKIEVPEWEVEEQPDDGKIIHIAKDYSDFLKRKALCGYKPKEPHVCSAGAPHGIIFESGMKECPQCKTLICTKCICEGIDKGLL